MKKSYEIKTSHKDLLAFVLNRDYGNQYAI